MRTIMIAEAIPSQNKGEAALMHGIVKTIRTHVQGEVFFYLCSESPREDEREYTDNIRIIGERGLVPGGDSPRQKLVTFLKSAARHLVFLVLHRLLGKYALSLPFFRGDLWKAYHEADVVIVGHDNAFSKFHIPLIAFCRLLGKKTIVYGTTIMPVVMNSRLSRVLGRFVLNKTALITTREPLTFKLLQEIGVTRPPMYCTADKAFILDPSAPAHVQGLMARLGIDRLPRPVIGVMVVKGSTVFKGAFKGRNYPPAEKYRKHIGEIAAALDTVIGKTGGSLVFIPHCIGPAKDVDDRLCAHDVRQEMKEQSRVHVINDELRVPELKGIMGTFDMVVTERTHGGINAATMLVPTLWITHPGDHRTYGIVSDTLGLPQCIYNIEYLESATLAEKILELYANRREIVDILKTSIPRAQETTMSNGVYFRQHVFGS